MPDLPTAAEQGLAVEAYTWNAIFAPKGTPADVVKKLNDAMSQAMDTPEVKERLPKLGAMLVPPDRAHARVSRRLRQERDREVGGADQGERRADRLMGAAQISRVRIPRTGGSPATRVAGTRDRVFGGAMSELECLARPAGPRLDTRASRVVSGDPAVLA